MGEKIDVPYWAYGMRREAGESGPDAAGRAMDLWYERRLGTESAIQTVYSLQHEYVSEDGEDQIKEIGLFSSRERAQEAIGRLRLKPGFRDHPDGFKVYETALDRDLAWEEGFVRVDPDDDTAHH